MSYSQEEMDARLKKNGWDWFLVSTMTPGVVRLQMGQGGEEETMWRKCFEGPTLEQAVIDAEAFIAVTSASDYGKTQNFDWGEAVEQPRALDVCPKCRGTGEVDHAKQPTGICKSCNGTGKRQ